MGLLFVLFFWAIFFVSITPLLGLIGNVFCTFIEKWKNVKLRRDRCFIAPGILLFGFLGLFFFENVAYGIVTCSDIGIGDYRNVNINSKYELCWIDLPNWRLDKRDSDELISEHFGCVKEILEHGDTIAFTSGTDKNYFLTQLNAEKVEYATIDSATTTNELWDRYIEPRGIDKDDIYTCDEYYYRYRFPFTIAILIFNICLFIFLIRRYWRRFLVEEEF